MKRPWNLVDSAVYSLSTNLNGNHNMNICTYVTPINMKPKLYAIAAYHQTKTLLHIENTEYCVLQILNETQYKLVNILGKKSGFNYDKTKYLSAKNLIADWQNFNVLKNALAYLLLRKTHTIPFIDHDLFTFDVIKYKVNNSLAPLTLDTLREHKIISV